MRRWAWWAVAVVLLAGPFVAVLVLTAARPQQPLVLAGGDPAVTSVAPAPLDYAPWAARIGAATGIPERAVLAYARAEVLLAAERPGCRLSWATLAGVARVESDHGRFGDRVLGADGRPNRPIIGVPLNGSSGVAAIPDTDDGVLDGDLVWDRAIGPLQFIPDTWDRWGRDTDGDGVADPQDLDDAAQAAGRYLCAAGGDLSTSDGWRRAVLGYNASRSYLRAVLSATNDYAAASRRA